MKRLLTLASKCLLGLAVGGATLALTVSPASAQGLGGGGLGGGGLGGGGAGGGGRTGGGGGGMQAGGLGGGSLAGTTGNASLGGGAGLGGGGGVGGAGGTNAVSPAQTSFYYQNSTNPLKPGLGSERKLASGNFKLTGGGGAGGGGGLGGGAGGGGIGTSSVSGFTTFSTSGNIVTYKQGSLNQPVFAIATTGGGVGGRAAGGGVGGLGQGGLGGGGLGQGGLGQNAGVGFNSLGMIRAPQYITEIAFEPVAKTGPVVPMETHLRGVLDRSTVFQGARGVQVAMDGNVVVLRGGVATDRDRRVAEALIRMSPGVNGVRNEIVVNGK